MAWRLALSLGGHVFIWMATGWRNSMTYGVLTLLGIACGSGLAARYISPITPDGRTKE